MEEEKIGRRGRAIKHKSSLVVNLPSSLLFLPNCPGKIIAGKAHLCGRRSVCHFLKRQAVILKATPSVED